uniref:N-acetyltransferase domain-containing protein n=1 Tax=Bionectria ochroleuca TaxID=29856 RepID=A0A8H7N9P2_BIOOC
MAIRALISPSPPSPEPGTVLLETERLLIRRYMLSDAPALAEIGNDPQVAIFMSDRFPNPYSVEDAETFIQNLNPQHDPTSPPEYPTTSAVLLKVAPADGHHHTPARRRARPHRLPGRAAQGRRLLPQLGGWLLPRPGLLG